MLASARSAGRRVIARGREWQVEETTPEVFAGIDIALFSAGGSTSKAFVPEAVARGCLVIDNSSYYRMDPDVPLVVPEINGEVAFSHQGVIANPNCSTAITLMGLYPLHRAFRLRAAVCSTYQAVSGSGAAGLAELESQTRAWAAGEPLEVKTYPAQIAFNLIPEVDLYQENGYTKEEMKMAHEVRKIASIPDAKISCTCVRVPVMRAHSIAVAASFDRPVDLAVARAAIEAFPGVELRDDTANHVYPMPLDYSRREVCGVGRLRKDLVMENGLSFWVVGDQLWKGAALNAVQILETLLRGQ